MHSGIALVARPGEDIEPRHDNDNHRSPDLDVADRFLNRFASLLLEPQALVGAEGEDQDDYRRRMSSLHMRGAIARGRARDIAKLLHHRHGGPCETDDGAVWLGIALPFVADAAELTGFSAYAQGLAWARSHCPLHVRRVGMRAVAQSIGEVLERRDGAERDRRTTNGVWARWTPDMNEIVEALRPTWAEITGLRLRGWRCIDRPDENEMKARDTTRKRDRRRAQGVRPQAERTKTRDLAVLAVELGKSPRTLERWSAAGTLDAKVEAARGVGNPSGPSLSITSGQKADSGGNDNQPPTVELPPDDWDWRSEFAFVGKVVGVLPEELVQLQIEFPGLDILALLPDLDEEIAAQGWEAPEAGPVLWDLLRARHTAARMAA